MLAFDRAERSDVGSSMIVQLGLFDADLRIPTRPDSRDYLDRFKSCLGGAR